MMTYDISEWQRDRFMEEKGGSVCCKMSSNDFWRDKAIKNDPFPSKLPAFISFSLTAPSFFI